MHNDSWDSTYSNRQESEDGHLHETPWDSLRSVNNTYWSRKITTLNKETRTQPWTTLIENKPFGLCVHYQQSLWIKLYLDFVWCPFFLCGLPPVPPFSRVSDRPHGNAMSIYIFFSVLDLKAVAFICIHARLLLCYECYDWQWRKKYDAIAWRMLNAFQQWIEMQCTLWCVSCVLFSNYV